MRRISLAHDYRYFPEPDLPPLVVSAERRARVAARLPELPEARKARFLSDYGLPEYDAELLTQSRGLADYFERAARASKNPKAASNWVMGEVLRTLKERDASIEHVPLSAERLAGLIALVDQGTISSTVAKDVFAKMYDSDREADAIVREEGLAQTSDAGALEGIVREVVEANPDAIEQIRKGRNNAFGFLVGQVMKASQGKANPKVVNELLKAAIGG